MSELTEKEVITYKQAKRLYELGFSKGLPRREYIFFWRSKGRFRELHNIFFGYIAGDPTYGGYKVYPAYTVGQLGEYLPFKINNNGKLMRLSIQKLSDGYSYIKYGYNNPEDNKNDVLKYSKNEAEARGDMLIYLIENKILYTKDKNVGK